MPTEGKSNVFTVIACVTFVVAGIVGAMKMENRLDPRTPLKTDRSEALSSSER